MASDSRRGRQSMLMMTFESSVAAVAPSTTPGRYQPILARRIMS